MPAPSATAEFLEQNPISLNRIFALEIQQKTPEISGKVKFIAGDLSRPDAARAPFYAVRIEVGDNELERLNDVKLMPGMPAEVFIRTAPRTVLSYLLKPLEDHLARAFRDG